MFVLDNCFISLANSYHEQFRMGKRSLLDVLNSENELFAARNGLLFEELNAVKSAYELFARMGILRNALEAEPVDLKGIRTVEGKKGIGATLLETAKAAESSPPHRPPTKVKRKDLARNHTLPSPTIPKPNRSMKQPQRVAAPPQRVAAALPMPSGTDETIREIRVVSLVANNTLFFPDETNALTNPYIGRPVNSTELFALRDQLTLLYVGKGFTSPELIQVDLPPKQGIVVFRIPEFRRSKFLDMSGQGLPSP